VTLAVLWTLAMICGVLRSAFNVRNSIRDLSDLPARVDGHLDRRWYFAAGMLMANLLLGGALTFFLIVGAVAVDRFGSARLQGELITYGLFVGGLVGASLPSVWAWTRRKTRGEPGWIMRLLRRG
jgi:hypothetical protein